MVEVDFGQYFKCGVVGVVWVEFDGDFVIVGQVEMLLCGGYYGVYFIVCQECRCVVVLM